MDECLSDTRASLQSTPKWLNSIGVEEPPRVLRRTGERTSAHSFNAGLYDDVATYGT